MKSRGRVTPDLEAPEAEHRAHVARLVGDGRLFEARGYVDALLVERYPCLDGLKRLLAPPVVRVVHEGPMDTHSMAPNAAWLRAHSAQHAGRRVALRDGVLVDSDSNLKNLTDRRRERGDPEADLVCIPVE
jgi:hypothetical protein